MENEGGFIGIVVATYPEGPAADVLLKDGSRLFGIPVMAHAASSATGLIDLPDIGLPLDDSRWNIEAQGAYDVRACVDIYDGAPVVSGFLFPQVSQMGFRDKNRRIDRHASDVYTTIDGNGNIEIVHPAGFYIRVGEGGAHEDLVGKDADKLWKPQKNATRQVNLHIEMPGGKASLNISPNGDIAINSDTTVDVTAPQVNVLQGDVFVPNGDVTISGKSFLNHTHGGISPGGSNTSKPN